jgi:DNA mismatch repair protein MutL
MPAIRALPEEVYRKIAAGEVIERPFSVVKELVENAMDAGAGDIRVTVAAGGKEFLRVEDDGHGFPPDEIELAFDRHCTSKLASLDDLDSLRTLGFRGEALPSIREVAEIELWTSDRDDGRGVRCRFLDWEIREREEIARRRGTSIEVRRLFHNLPVRRKFLKSDSGELNPIVAYLEQAALSRPEIAFSLASGRRVLFAYPRAAGLDDRIYQVFGRDFLADLQPVEYSDGGWRLHGQLSRPGTGIGTKNRQFFFVNGRPVRERTLIAAFNQAFSEHLEKSRSPAGVLFLDLPPADIDVNIHPMKLEIRFRDGRRVFSLVQRAVSAALGRAVRRGIDLEPPLAGARPFASGPAAISPQAVAGFLFAGTGGSDAPGPESGFTLLGQYAATYIVAERNGALLVVDQHNAHEKILYERLRGGRAAPAPVLFPLLIELSPAERRCLDDEKREFLSGIGFDIEMLGESALQVRAYPAALDERRVRDAVLGVLHLAEGGKPDPERMLAEVACKSAVKANQRLQPEPMRALLADLFALDNFLFCPHRRPVLAEFSLEGIEKLMKRR